MSDRISAARVAEGGLTGISDNLLRMRELTVQARNGTLGDEERAVLQQEFDALAEEVDRTSATTDFNGRSLLDGGASGTGAIVLDDGSGEQPVELDIDDHSAAALGLEGLSLTDPATLDALDAAQQTVSASRAELGTAENRLGSQIRSLRIQQDETAAAHSRIADADLAETASRKTANSIMRSFQVSVQLQANASAGVALLLLR